MEREPGLTYVASISHGKDSNAMLHVIMDILHYPLDRIVTTDVWFDENLRAELPPMVEWKNKADQIIFEKWGIPVEHLCATRGGCETVIQEHSGTVLKNPNMEQDASRDFQNRHIVGAKNLKLTKFTYKDRFYQTRRSTAKHYPNMPTGFPMIKGAWCNSDLKMQPLNFCEEKEVGWCNT